MIKNNLKKFFDLVELYKILDHLNLKSKYCFKKSFFSPCNVFGHSFQILLSVIKFFFDRSGFDYIVFLTQRFF